LGQEALHVFTHLAYSIFPISVLFTFAGLCSTLFYLLSNVNHCCLLFYEVRVIQELPVVAVPFIEQVKIHIFILSTW
jgi:hypothetical protein